MALTSGVALMRRGPPAPGEYGYAVAPGEQIWRGGLVGLNAAGQLVRMQTGTPVAFAGVAMQDYSNVGNAAASRDFVHVARGIWGLTVPNATAANLNAPVYAIDDNSLTLAQPTVAVVAGANTGNGTVVNSSVRTAAAGPGAAPGAYTLTLTSGTAYTVTAPNGTVFGPFETGADAGAGGLGWTILPGSTAFAAGDHFTLTVANSLVAGTINGFGQSGESPTWLRLTGS